MKVNVALRIRPLVGTEEPAVQVLSDGTFAAGGKAHAFASSVVAGRDQALAFDALAAPLLSRLLEGYSCTLLAYGQTGSGKTHTMFGPPGSLTEASLQAAGGTAPASWGMFPRAVLHLLRLPGLGRLHASAVEVYQEKAYDLLADRAQLAVGVQKTGRKVAGVVSVSATGKRADANGVHPSTCRCGPCYKARNMELAERLATLRSGHRPAAKSPRVRAPQQNAANEDAFATVGETLWELATPPDVARLARMVESTRVAHAHNLNARSSRSHCLVHVHLTHRGPDSDSISRRQLLFVDLAGSERIERTGVDGRGKAQAVSINSSLTVLGKVVKALQEGSTHVPFRDSTLTMLLRSSFAGRACTSVVVNVAAEPSHLDETLCTLSFGKRLANVVTRAAVVLGSDAGAEEVALRTRLAEVEHEIARLKACGQGGRFGEGAAASEQHSFLENVRRRDEEVGKASVALQLLAEARGAAATSRGGGGEGAWARERVAVLKARAERAHAEAANLRDIILRQKSIKGFWHEASPGFVQYESLRVHLMGQLAMLGGASCEPQSLDGMPRVSHKAYS